MPPGSRSMARPLIQMALREPIPSNGANFGRTLQSRWPGTHAVRGVGAHAALPYDHYQQTLLQSSTAYPRFGTSTLRSYVMNTVPSAFLPVVLTVTIPWVGRLADSRFDSTSDSA